MPKIVGTGSPKAHRKESGMLVKGKEISISGMQGGRGNVGSLERYKV